ncbi:peptidoglycan DD-metalloendopeptidase family protein [Vibrio maritimus]
MFRTQLQQFTKTLYFNRETSDKVLNFNALATTTSLALIAMLVSTFSTDNYQHSPTSTQQSFIGTVKSTDSLNYSMPAPPISGTFIGKVKGSFFISALDSGLSSKQVSFLFNTLNQHFDFFNSVEDGGQFIVHAPYGDKLTFKGFLYQDKRKSFSVWVHGNNRMYNSKAEPLIPILLTNPTFSNYPISSHFDPLRVHPVTRRTVPHNGTDYMLPVGSSVVSVGSGEVIAARYDRYAGHYISIRHTDNYISRYLHLSKTLVSVGDQVTAGQKIAKSGNSGRTTGAHLHFELLKNGRPIDFVEWSNEDNNKGFKAELTELERREIIAQSERMKRELLERS